MTSDGPPDPAEARLVTAAVRRDPQAWAELYERFSGPVLGFFVHQLRDHATAEDMTSEVFIEALRGAGRFRGDLADLRAWLFHIARNNLIDRYRQQRRNPTESLETTGETDLARATPSIDPGDAAIAALDRSRILDAVRALSPDQREVVLLRMSGGLTAPEIAAIVGKTTGAVKALQHRALVALALALQPAPEAGP